MTTTYLTYEGFGTPRDALEDASSVLAFVQDLLCANDGAVELTRDGVSGLNITLEIVQHAITKVAEEIHQVPLPVAERAKTGAVPAPAFGAMPKEAGASDDAPRPGDQAPTTDDGDEEESYPRIAGTGARLSPRRQAIKSLVAGGYSIESAARAVNMKKAAVSLIVAELVDTGHLSADAMPPALAGNG